MKANRRMVLVLGAILMIFGILVVLFPTSLWILFSLVLGVSLLLSGIFGIAIAIINKSLQFPGMILAMGILNFILGILLLISYSAPILQTLFSRMIAIWAIIRGTILLIDAFQNKKAGFKYRWIDLAVAVLLLVLASLLIINPFGGASVITMLFGLSVIGEGIAMMIFSFKLKNAKEIKIKISEKIGY